MAVTWCQRANNGGWVLDTWLCLSLSRLEPWQPDQIGHSGQFLVRLENQRDPQHRVYGLDSVLPGEVVCFPHEKAVEDSESHPVFCAAVDGVKAAVLFTAQASGKPRLVFHLRAAIRKKCQ